ncbi:MAG: right-handed parallel beta-helix repeat-containing protein [Spirochaetia bacterium]|nr:right-handed parallel beta-helix repeat-containing protein [Spirochaetia bacterium]
MSGTNFLIKNKTNVLVINSEFGDTTSPGVDGLNIQNCRNVLIYRCTVSNVAGEGIHIYATNEYGTENVTILDSLVSHAREDGIKVETRDDQVMPFVNPMKNVRILSNRIRHTGLGTTSLPAARHGMYVKAQDALIEGNLVFHSYYGSAITLRSSGVIRGNRCGYSYQWAIGMTSQTRLGPSKTVLIENNVIYMDLAYAGSTIGGGIRYSKDSTTAMQFPPEKSITRFNTLHFKNEYALPQAMIQLSSSIASNEVYGNLLVDQRSTPIYIGTSPGAVLSQNYQTSSASVFIDAVNHDYRLASASQAIGFANGLTRAPALDIEGKSRPTQGSLDAGAYEN